MLLHHSTFCSGRMKGRLPRKLAASSKWRILVFGRRCGGIREIDWAKISMKCEYARMSFTTAQASVSLYLDLMISCHTQRLFRTLENARRHTSLDLQWGCKKIHLDFGLMLIDFNLVASFCKRVSASQNHHMVPSASAIVSLLNMSSSY